MNFTCLLCIVFPARTFFLGSKQRILGWIFNFSPLYFHCSIHAQLSLLSISVCSDLVFGML